MSQITYARGKYCTLIVQALRLFDGEAKRSKVHDAICKMMAITERSMQAKTDSGVPYIEKDIDFARHFLKVYGFIVAPEDKGYNRGSWTLTRKAMRADLDHIDFETLIHQCDVKEYRNNSKILKIRK